MVARALLLAAATGFLLAGCIAPASYQRTDAPPEVIRSQVRYHKEYILAPGDQVEISVWRVPEASRTVVVRPDGLISLPLLQDVKAEGLTPRELAESLREKLSKRLLNPEVAVIPQQIRQPMIYVLGDVKAPGGFPARNAVTAVQALALAGGPLRTGNEYYVSLIRLNAEGYLEAIPINNPSADQTKPYFALAAVVLQPDDIIFVPESGRAQIMRVLSDFLVPFQIYLNYKLIASIVT